MNIISWDMFQQKLIFTCLVFSISLNIPNSTGTIFYQHLQVIVIQLLRFSQFCAMRCLCQLVRSCQLVYTLVFLSLIKSQHFDCIIRCVTRKIAAYGNHFSLNERFRIIFLPVCRCLYLVVMTAFPMQIITYRFMKILVLIEWMYWVSWYMVISGFNLFHQNL